MAKRRLQKRAGRRVSLITRDCARKILAQAGRADTMPAAEELLQRAAEFRRLAPTCTTPGLSELLLTLASDLERDAAKVAQTTPAPRPAPPKSSRQERSVPKMKKPTTTGNLRTEVGSKASKSSRQLDTDKEMEALLARILLDRVPPSSGITNSAGGAKKPGTRTK